MSTSDPVVTPNDEPQDDLVMPSELDVLKDRARLMGVPFSNNISLETLRDRVAAKQSELDAPAAAPAVENSVAKATANPLVSKAEQPDAKPMSLRNYLLGEATKLVRLRITNMDPKKADLPGEIFTVANEYIGTIKKYVPFGESTDNGYHVPHCIYEMLKTRQFLQIKTKTHPVTKQIETKTQWVREFSLEVLDPLTPAELAQLATTQAASGSLN